jgi:F-type H+-transporting ATPase subunit b
MDQTLRQVGELLRGALPTVVLLLLLYAVYHYLLHRPLQRVLEERRNRTQGAMDRARADIAAAEAKAAEYEERLRDARMAVFRSQEGRRQQAQQARAAIVVQARAVAADQVEQARTQIQQDVDAAKQVLRADSDRLAAEIIHTILQPVGSSRVPATGGQ